MSRLRTSAALIVLLAATALGGCAAESASNEGATEASESDLSRSHRIVAAPLATDVVREYMALAKASFARAKARHPSTQTLTPALLDGFTDGEGNLDTALGTMLWDRPSHEVSVADAMSELEAYATDKITEAAGADGRVGSSLSEVPRGLSSFFSQARDTLARSMLRTTLHSSDGIAIDRMLDEWTRIERFVDASFTPYQLAGRPTLASVQRVLEMRDVSPTKTGDAAVTAFAQALEDADGRYLDPLTTMWKSSSVKQQFLFEYGEDGIGGTVLAIVDEHRQMFVFTIHHEA